MGEKTNLIKMLPVNVKRDSKSVMTKVYENTWQVYAKACDLKPVPINSKIERILKQPGKGIGLDEGERKKHYWQILSNAQKFLGKIESGSEQVIPLPHWNDEFWEGLPVFTYKKDGSNPRFTIAPSDLLIDEDQIEPAVPLSAGAVHKIQTNLPIENLKQAFAEMVRQGWLDEGVENLVEYRFTNSLIREPVEVGVESFSWLNTQALLREVVGVLKLEKASIPPHFMHRGKPLRKDALRSGPKQTERNLRSKAIDLLKPFLP
jgi:hypothetical protein